MISFTDANNTAREFIAKQLAENERYFTERGNNLLTVRKFIAAVHDRMYIDDDMLAGQYPYFNNADAEKARDAGRFDNWLEGTCYTGIDNLNTSASLTIERDDLKRLHAIVGTCEEVCKWAADATHAFVVITPKDGEFKDLNFSYKRAILDDDNCTIKTTKTTNDYHSLSCLV